MDPSALIFVALAVAWAAYLIPRALEHHEESARSRSIDKFSHGLRILARREPLGRRTSTLVTVSDPGRDPVAMMSAEERRALLHAHRRATAAAARRRRRILGLLVLASLAVATAAVLGRVAWVWMAVPAGSVLVWLVVGRLSARGARRRWAGLVGAPVSTGSVALLAAVVEDDTTTSADVDGGVLVGSTGVEVALPKPSTDGVAGWDMLPFVVPTYVVKEQVRRSVRTIDLDSTGVWSSGRSDIDSALVRDAAAAQPGHGDHGDDRDEQALGS